MSSFPFYPGISPQVMFSSEGYPICLNDHTVYNPFNSTVSYDCFHFTNPTSIYSFSDTWQNANLEMTTLNQFASRPNITSNQPWQPSFQQNQIQQMPETKQKTERKFEKEIESAKKNSQSNIVNHFFSFFNTRQKSEKIIQRCLQGFKTSKSQKEKLIYLFYNTIHILSMKKGRKYVNRKNLLNLFQPKTLTEILPEIKIKTEKISSIRVEDLCKLFRKCCIFFMKNKSIVSIITSKRISKIARELHLSRRRKVLKALEDYEK